jgi:tungstate transport system substrate-binding protein
MERRKGVIVLLSLLFVIFSFYGAVSAVEKEAIVLATTTSVQDTGLLEVLLDRFQQDGGYLVKAIAVGTGQALQLGRQGEADILWVHSPDDEKKFIEDGYGTNRITFMHNDFVLLGPAGDPAGVKGNKNVLEAFKKIARSKALFVSRGDRSGTHKKELKIWQEIGLAPEKGSTYLEVGQGMAATLGIANEKQGYCLVDRSTYLSLKKTISLVIVFAGDDRLLNRYSLMLVNTARFPKVNGAGAKALYYFLLSKKTSVIVDNYGKDKFGQQLFFYDYAVKGE